MRRRVSQLTAASQQALLGWLGGLANDVRVQRAVAAMLEAAE